MNTSKSLTNNLLGGWCWSIFDHVKQTNRNHGKLHHHLNDPASYFGFRNRQGWCDHILLQSVSPDWNDGNANAEYGNFMQEK